MRNTTCSLVLLLACFSLTLMAQESAAPQVVPLCELQKTVSQGEHRTVRVEGLYSAGLEHQQLVDPSCPNQSTAIEFALKSHRLWDKLVRVSNEPKNQARVVFEGEFYGPPVPDPKLPEAIRKQYHPGWDYNSMTKLVVQSIGSVETVPNPGGSSVMHESGHAASVQAQASPPSVTSTGVPFYPPLARAARVEGVVHVKVVTDGEKVVTAEAEDGHKLLVGAAEYNAKTWVFKAHAPTTFTVTYRYNLTDQSTNPYGATVILLLPNEVQVLTTPIILSDPNPDPR